MTACCSIAPHVAYGGAGRTEAPGRRGPRRGLMVFLDVVYNHFGPDGNYLHLYAPDFFHPERQHAVGRRHRLREAAGARLLHRERALLARGIPLRRPALRRRRPDRRPVGRAASSTSSRRAVRGRITGPAYPSDDRGRPQHHAAARARRAGPRRALHGGMERRLPPRRACDRDRRNATATTATIATTPVGAARARAGRGLRLSGRAVALSRRRACAASRARICRRPPSSTSCRTTTRSATAPSASG